jgi:hypothetical protein
MDALSELAAGLLIPLGRWLHATFVPDRVRAGGFHGHSRASHLACDLWRSPAPAMPVLCLSQRMVSVRQSATRTVQRLGDIPSNDYLVDPMSAGSYQKTALF